MPKKPLTRKESKAVFEKIVDMEATLKNAIETGKLNFQCCFCHKSILGDVTALILVTKWNRFGVEQRDQQWFCHAECFSATTGETIDVLVDA